MLKFETTAQYRQEYKRARKRGLDMSLIDSVILTLLAQKPLDAKHEDHPLSGKFQNCRECHIQPNWLLIYRIDKNILTLTAVRTGSHADLFR